METGQYYKITEILRTSDEVDKKTKHQLVFDQPSLTLFSLEGSGNIYKYKFTDLEFTGHTKSLFIDASEEPKIHGIKNEGLALFSTTGSLMGYNFTSEVSIEKSYPTNLIIEDWDIKDGDIFILPKNKASTSSLFSDIIWFDNINNFWTTKARLFADGQDFDQKDIWIGNDSKLAVNCYYKYFLEKDFISVRQDKGLNFITCSNLTRNLVEKIYKLWYFNGPIILNNYRRDSGSYIGQGDGNYYHREVAINLCKDFSYFDEKLYKRFDSSLIFDGITTYKDVEKLIYNGKSLGISLTYYYKTRAFKNGNIIGLGSFFDEVDGILKPVIFLWREGEGYTIWGFNNESIGLFNKIDIALKNEFSIKDVELVEKDDGYYCLLLAQPDDSDYSIYLLKLADFGDLSNQVPPSNTNRENFDKEFCETTDIIKSPDKEKIAILKEESLRIFNKSNSINPVDIDIEKAYSSGYNFTDSNNLIYIRHSGIVNKAVIKNRNINTEVESFVKEFTPTKRDSTFDSYEALIGQNLTEFKGFLDNETLKFKSTVASSGNYLNFSVLPPTGYLQYDYSEFENPRYGAFYVVNKTGGIIYNPISNLKYDLNVKASKYLTLFNSENYETAQFLVRGTDTSFYWMSHFKETTDVNPVYQNFILNKYICSTNTHSAIILDKKVLKGGYSEIQGGQSFNCVDFVISNNNETGFFLLNNEVETSIYKTVLSTGSWIAKSSNFINITGNPNSNLSLAKVDLYVPDLEVGMFSTSSVTEFEETGVTSHQGQRLFVEKENERDTLFVSSIDYSLKKPLIIKYDINSGIKTNENIVSRDEELYGTATQMFSTPIGATGEMIVYNKYTNKENQSTSCFLSKINFQDNVEPPEDELEGEDTSVLPEENISKYHLIYVSNKKHQKLDCDKAGENLYVQFDNSTAVRLSNYSYGSIEEITDIQALACDNEYGNIVIGNDPTTNKIKKSEDFGATFTDIYTHASSSVFSSPYGEGCFVDQNNSYFFTPITVPNYNLIKKPHSSASSTVSNSNSYFPSNISANSDGSRIVIGYQSSSGGGLKLAGSENLSIGNKTFGARNLYLYKSGLNVFLFYYDLTAYKINYKDAILPKNRWQSESLNSSNSSERSMYADISYDESTIWQARLLSSLTYNVGLLKNNIVMTNNNGEVLNFKTDLGINYSNSTEIRLKAFTVNGKQKVYISIYDGSKTYIFRYSDEAESFRYVRSDGSIPSQPVTLKTWKLAFSPDVQYAGSGIFDTGHFTQEDDFEITNFKVNNGKLAFGFNSKTSSTIDRDFNYFGAAIFNTGTNEFGSLSIPDTNSYYSIQAISGQRGAYVTDVYIADKIDRIGVPYTIKRTGIHFGGFTEWNASLTASSYNQYLTGISKSFERAAFEENYAGSTNAAIISVSTELVSDAQIYAKQNNEPFGSVLNLGTGLIIDIDLESTNQRVLIKEGEQNGLFSDPNSYNVVGYKSSTDFSNFDEIKIDTFNYGTGNFKKIERFGSYLMLNRENGEIYRTFSTDLDKINVVGSYLDICEYNGSSCLALSNNGFIRRVNSLSDVSYLTAPTTGLLTGIKVGYDALKDVAYVLMSDKKSIYAYF
jgi:hypothetical protein